MAAPQGGYPPEGYPQDGYGQQQQQQPYADQAYGAAPAQPIAPSGATHGGRKKRAYAGQAFEFGSGANAGLGGQLPAGGAYGGYPTPPQPQGYPQQAYGAEPVAMSPQGFAPPESMPPMAGYQPAVEGYPPQAAASNVGQVAQQFGQMSMGAQPPLQAQRGAPLNQLYPTDLLTQPFNVAELDYPPPPIILPPNVSIHYYNQR